MAVSGVIVTDTEEHASYGRIANAMKLTHMDENTVVCGEIKLYFYPSAGGLKKKMPRLCLV